MSYEQYCDCCGEEFVAPEFSCYCPKCAPDAVKHDQAYTVARKLYSIGNKKKWGEDLDNAVSVSAERFRWMFDNLHKLSEKEATLFREYFKKHAPKIGESQRSTHGHEDRTEKRQLD